MHATSSTLGGDRCVSRNTPTARIFAHSDGKALNVGIINYKSLPTVRRATSMLRKSGNRLICSLNKHTKIVAPRNPYIGGLGVHRWRGSLNFSANIQCSSTQYILPAAGAA